MTTSRTEHNRNNRTKAQGQHNTPQGLAAFLAAVTLQAAERPIRRIIDPACGYGELLAAIYQALPASERADVHLVGMDTDEAAVAEAGKRLDPTGASFQLATADFLTASAPSLFQRREISEPFDLAIVNPPYVRTQTLGQRQVQSLRDRFGLTGRIDLYQAFVVALASVMRPGAVLGLLCTNRLLFTKAGHQIRHHLRTSFDLKNLIDLGDTKLFQAAVLPAIVVAERTDKPTRPSPPYVAVYEASPNKEKSPQYASVLDALTNQATGLIEAGGSHLLIRRGFLPSDTTDKEPWMLSNDRIGAFLSQVRDRSRFTWGDVGQVRVGIKTTADSIFIRDDWEDLPSEVRPEDDLLRPLLTHHIADRWCARSPAFRVLYPHEEGQRRAAAAVDLTVFPRALAYLERHRSQLAARRYVTDSGRSWYEHHVPQRPALWPKEKVVFPDIASQPRFFVDRSGAIVNGDCYWIPIDDRQTAGLITAVGNSRMAIRFYDAVCGNQLYSGRRRFMTQYVARFPLPDTDLPSTKHATKAALQLIAGDGDPQQLEPEIDAAIWESFGFSEEPRW